MNSFLAQIDVIVATSDNYIESSNILQQYRHKVCTIPLGISKQSYPVPTEQKITEIENKVGKDFFLFVGTLRKYKNLHILLDVLKNITLQCVIVGSGPEEKALKHYAKKMQITNVKFTGRVSDIDKVAFIKLCRALVLPSNLRSEAFGVVLLEGAMYKKPLISTELGTGSSYVNIDGKTGIVVPPSNMDALQEAMLLLDRDEVLANKMGQAAFERYNELFTGEVMGEQYAELYEALLKESVDD
jgi:rhamnosyl/mannosyltransferase